MDTALLPMFKILHLLIDKGSCQGPGYMTPVR